MEDSKQNVLSLTHEQQSKYALRKVFFIIAKIIGGLAVIAGLVASGIAIYNNFIEPDIKSKFSRYKDGKVVIYSGELSNDSSYHAENVMLTGRFNTEIVKVDINAKDPTDKNEINKPLGSIVLSFSRLAGRSKCRFDIILICNQPVCKEREIEEQLHVSWGKKGKLSLSPEDVSDDVNRWIKLGKTSVGLDLSRKARQKWFEDNAKNIR